LRGPLAFIFNTPIILHISYDQPFFNKTSFLSTEFMEDNIGWDFP
jgi:hypothetical protein